MAIKQVILHLGMAKTGSSSIQDTLFHNTVTLEKFGFRYLTEWGVNHIVKLRNLFSQNPSSPTGTEHLGKPVINIKQKNKESIETMLQAIRTTECETLILSGEYFHELFLDSTIENIKQFINKYFQCNGIECTIVYFVRNPLTWLISSLQQQVFQYGYLNKNCDYFETRMKQYEGVFNLKKHFSDSLTLLKFEDACIDKDGLPGCFLKSIGFPEGELNNINILRVNESRCMEVMELVNYIETVEPLYPYDNYRRFNPHRTATKKDLGLWHYLKDIKGIKYDLPHQSKLELWDRFSKTVKLLKENTGIDYVDYTPPLVPAQETYSEETIEGFIKSFPKLNFTLRKHFLKFFEKKYMETAQVKFKQLHFKDSIPWKIYNSEKAFQGISHLLNFKKVQENLMFRKIKKRLKRIYWRTRG